jgi:hypothetical protein
MSLHGLKQPSHGWYCTFQDIMILIPLEASRVDGGQFVPQDQDQASVIAPVIQYVEDLLIVTNECLIGLPRDQLKKRFRMHDEGSVFFNLNVSIGRNWEYHLLNIHLQNFLPMILATFRLDVSRPVVIPMVTKPHARKPAKAGSNSTIYLWMI